MTVYVRKQQTIDALQWTGDNVKEMQEFAGDHFSDDACGWCDPCACEDRASILVREGHRWRSLYVGDYVVQYSSESFSIMSQDELERDYVKVHL